MQIVADDSVLFFSPFYFLFEVVLSLTGRSSSEQTHLMAPGSVSEVQMSLLITISSPPHSPLKNKQKKFWCENEDSNSLLILRSSNMFHLLNVLKHFSLYYHSCFVGGVGKRFLAHPFVLLLKALNLDMDVTKDVPFTFLYFFFNFRNLEEFVKKELESICLINANSFCLLVKVSFFSSICYSTSAAIFRCRLNLAVKAFTDHNYS